MTQSVLLCILDGWGISPDHRDDATWEAKTPNYCDLLKNMSHTTIHADGEYVGLPSGQMGNSEVGHLNMGAGRIVYQELTKINKAIKEGTFFKNEEFLKAAEHAGQNNSSLHLMGLLSDGGVHSSIEHLKALIKFAKEQGLKKVYVHALLDGRDTPPKSAINYITDMENYLKEMKMPAIASIMGRYWAMDRDKRWDRVEKAYNCLVSGEGETAPDALTAIQNSYNNNVTDEFVEPAVTGGERISDNDSVIFFNFRPDRSREITSAIVNKDFDGFERKKVVNNLYFVQMTRYDENLPLPTAFKPQTMDNILGQVLEQKGIKEFRTAETEKYAHITFFFNGGVEEPGKLETRCLVPSPKVATYDLKPEMSAYEVCDKVLCALDEEKYGFILVNFANPDMVGHTGIMEAAIKACEAVDTCVGKIYKKALEKGVKMLLTADHGNAEWMYNEVTHEPQTAHTTNPVPFIIVDKEHYKLKETGALCDIAPTVLDLMGIEKPKEMTGESLIVK